MTDRELDLLYEILERTEDEEEQAVLRKAIFIIENMQ